jgi:hypothetical protein
MTLIKIDGYTSSGIAGDVSYDIYFGSAATGQVSYKVMIWLVTSNWTERVLPAPAETCPGSNSTLPRSLDAPRTL